METLDKPGPRGLAGSRVQNEVTPQGVWKQVNPTADLRFMTRSKMRSRHKAYGSVPGKRVGGTARGKSKMRSRHKAYGNDPLERLGRADLEKSKMRSRHKAYGNRSARGARQSQ